jgi:hypothetical protein
MSAAQICAVLVTLRSFLLLDVIQCRFVVLGQSKNLHYITSQKHEDLIYTAVEARNHKYLLVLWH